MTFNFFLKIDAPQTTVSTPPLVHEAPRPVPPVSIPKSYPKQQYSPMGLSHNHSPQHSQPYTPPPITTSAQTVPVVTTAGVVGSYPSPQLPNHAGYPPQQAFAPPVNQPPPPYVSNAAAPSQMQAPPLLDGGGYHLQGNAVGPTAPPDSNHRPPAMNPHYHGNM